MPIAVGTRLGAYEIVGVLGAGGMGEVYSARDTRLGRDVAIKVLPDRFASDPERIARFQREAQVLASLNDPHIGALYGLEESQGTLALVLELVEGPTLADRIAAGALHLDEALVIARQMALAIEAAHDKAIIHRDLKPSNVKVRPDGTVKILDFGLAKLLETDQPSSSVTMSPTLSVHATYAGMILGTAAYMSPEQARGKPVDRRTDIWAFGCVLYEMLSGKQTFAAGETVSDAIAAIIRSEPDWSALPAATPEPIRKLLRRCLAKDPRDRLHDIADARLEISDALTVGASRGPAVAPRRTRELIAWITAAAALAAAIVAGISYRNRPADARIYRSEIVPPAILQSDPSGRFALSPDGRRLAFLAPGAGGRRLLWVRSLDSVAAQPLAGTEDAMYPFWSPDSRFLAFVAGGKLKRIDASGGTALTLADAGGAGAWSRDDVILFTPRPGSSALFRIPSGGGTPSPVTTLADGETRHSFPVFLPDGRRFFYVASRATKPVGTYVGALDSNDRKRILDGGSNVAYAQGFLVFLREATLLARPFDPPRLEFTADAVPLAEKLLITPVHTGAFTVSDTGALVYQTGIPGGPLTWLDSSGKRLEALGDRGLYQDVQISPDGTKVAVSLASDLGGNRDIWLLDVRRSVRTRLTFDPADDYSPVWSPDGRWIAFASNRKGRFDLYRKEVGGAEGDEALLVDHLDKVPFTWSPDGRFILYHTLSETTGTDLWLLPLSPNAKPVPFLQTAFNETQAVFSPDGRWVAYMSSESGQNEVYVAPFPAGRGKWQVSTAGGIWPRWRRDGMELFYHALQRQDLMAASVSVREKQLEFGAPRRLFDVGIGGGRFRYDVSPDGQRFLVNATEDENATPLTLVLNWPAALKK